MIHLNWFLTELFTDSKTFFQQRYEARTFNATNKNMKRCSGWRQPPWWSIWQTDAEEEWYILSTIP